MSIERRVLFLANAMLVIVALLSLRLVYWQLIRGEDLKPVALNPVEAAQTYAEMQAGNQDNPDQVVDAITSENPAEALSQLPQPVIQRTAALLENITRGTIYDRNGRVLAEDQLDAEGWRTRFYSEPSLAHVIGYVSGLRVGVTGLELSYNEALLGLNRPEVQLGQLLHQPIAGSALQLTIDSRIQREAEEALGNRPGAVIVLDGESGAVLAMVSAPGYDPNRILDPAYNAGLLQNCGDNPACQGALVNRATQALYAPGSTWKTITLIAGLDSGQITPDTVFDFGRARKDANGKTYYVYEVDGGVIPDPNHAESRLALPMAYAKSANAAFARIADEMPPEVLIEYAQRFGFSPPDPGRFSVAIPTSTSQLAGNLDELRTNNLLQAATGIGQGELLATPLNMAMVVEAVVNDGDLPMPYFVEKIGTTDVSRTRRVLRNLMKGETAREVRDMMLTSVNRGSGRAAIIQGVTVGGKTGTAQLGGSQSPHAWFTGFAENGRNRVVIAVVVEHGGEGSVTAAPIFARVASVALEQLAQPLAEIEPQTVVSIEQPAAPPPSPVVNVLPADFPKSIDPKLFFPFQSCEQPEEIQAGSGNFIWPSQYHKRSGLDFREKHVGIDLNAPEGSAVYAADTGVVVFAGWTNVGYGNAVLIDHRNGYVSLYAHLSQISTFCGAPALQGEIIGISGNTGNSKGPHLHFEIRTDEGFVNPWKLMPEP